MGEVVFPLLYDSARHIRVGWNLYTGDTYGGSCGKAKKNAVCISLHIEHYSSSMFAAMASIHLPRKAE